MLETVLVSFVTAVVTAAGTFLLQERRLRAEMRTEFMAERAARMLLEHPDWSMRSLGAIANRLHGISEAQLREILIGAGAVRFEGEEGKEMWGLIRRNEAALRRGARSD